MNLTPAPRRRLLRPQEFLGRERLRRELIEAVSEGQHLQVNGPRRSGKTWGLEWLRRTLPERESTRDSLLLHVSMTELGDPTPGSFYQAIETRIRRADSDLAELIEVTADLEANGSSLIDFARDVGATGRRVVVVLDEFELLAQSERCSSSFFNQLRTVGEVEGVSLIVASQRPLREVCHREALGSTLWGLFRRHIVKPFGRADVESALEAWLGQPKGAIPKPVVSEAHRQSGGWPMVLAEIALHLRRSGDLTLNAVQSLASDLRDQFEADVLGALEDAERRMPGASAVFRGLCSDSEPVDGAKAHLKTLADVGLLVSARHSVVTWPFAREIVESERFGLRTTVFTAAPPLIEEWADLAGHHVREAEALGAPPDLVRSLRHMMQATRSLDIWAETRFIYERVLDWLSDAIPPVALDRDGAPVAFAARRQKHQRLAHLRRLSSQATSGSEFDIPLAKMIQLLATASQFGHHHDGTDLDAAEGGAILILAARTVARAAAAARQDQEARGVVARPNRRSS